MNKFRPTYLYVKTHNETGLKYFGKTSKDPFEYLGSGIHWRRHLKQHGKNVSTEIIGFFVNERECIDAAIKFSRENDIVRSSNWANLVEENGIDGGANVANRRTYRPVSEETRKKLSSANKGKIAWNKGILGATPGNRNPRSESIKRKISESLAGKKLSLETRKKISSANTGHPVSEVTRKKISESNRGKKRTEEQKIKLRGKRNLSEESRKRIRDARAKQKFSEETRKKLSGKVIVLDLNGNVSRISKEQYYSQIGPKESWQFLFHRNALAKKRKR